MKFWTWLKERLRRLEENLAVDEEARKTDRMREAMRQGWDAGELAELQEKLWGRSTGGSIGNDTGRYS